VHATLPTVVTLLIVKIESCHGHMKCVNLGYLSRQPALLSAHWIMPSSPFIVPLIVFLGKLAEWHQTSLLYSCQNPSVYLYYITACPLRKSQLKSLDSVINSVIRKIFDTKSQDVGDIFNCLPAESLIANRRCKFLGKISVSENKLCSIFVANAVKKTFRVTTRVAVRRYCINFVQL